MGKSKRLNFVVTEEDWKRVGKLPKDVEYGPAMRACLQAWLDGKIKVAANGAITIGEATAPSSDPLAALSAEERDVVLWLRKKHDPTDQKIADFVRNIARGK